ncbi:CBS domain-containing protein [Streptomyces katsurahamanus]|uniref:CBS domain-containing protein n=1 Tax=Streptomyces katsurahamanus TaxID=2577098 RepID=A0ABW9NWF4_9ACTN|nr:CBS domain-containing protein [Streptomyces katsurahamanus]MQS37499.1 CBS domain-containing protein [Streptomyces katsurahamanus]
MRAWTVRGGRDGEREEKALAEELVIVGWEEVGDLGGCGSLDEVAELLATAYPEKKPGTRDSWARQLWRFMSMEVGDYVVMPRKHLRVMAVGRLVGPYEYRAQAAPGFRHVRRTDWVRRGVERAAVRGDLRDSMGAFSTVSELSRRDAAARVRAIAETGSDPGYDGAVTPPADVGALIEDVRDDGVRQLTARDLIALWGWQRRTTDVIDLVDEHLASLGLQVEPHFTAAQLDGLVTVSAAEQEGAEEEPGDGSRGDGASRESGAAADSDKAKERDLTWRIGNLPFVRDVVTVHEDDELKQATTPMFEHEYSQIPVVDRNHVLRGVITWEGIARAQIGGRTATVRNAMDPHPEASRVDQELFRQLDRIQESGFTVIVDGENTVIGILTSTDLAGQLKQRVEPFIVLEELERRLRRLTAGFSVEELPRDIRKTRQKGQHLSLGQYRSIVADPECWKKLDWPFDQQDILARLKVVSKYRNDLAHWAVDAPSEDAEALDATARLLKLLKVVDRDPSG